MPAAGVKGSEGISQTTKAVRRGGSAGATAENETVVKRRINGKARTLATPVWFATEHRTRAAPADGLGHIWHLVLLPTSLPPSRLHCSLDSHLFPRQLW